MFCKINVDFEKNAREILMELHREVFVNFFISYLQTQIACAIMNALCYLENVLLIVISNYSCVKDCFKSMLV